MIMKDIEGFEGLYKITEDGQVWGVKRGHFIAQRYDKCGYKRCNLSKDGKMSTHYIHQLVAKAFIPNPENKPTVNHIDENKENNHYTNLNWMTMKEQTNHATRTSRAAAARCKPVRNIDTGEVYESLKAANAAVGASSGQICNAIKKGYRCCGYYWEYVEANKNDED